MHKQVTALRNLVARATGVEAVVDIPLAGDLREGAVVVWPWRMEEDATVHSRPPGSKTSEGPAPAVVHCVVWAASLQVLDKVRVAVHASPLITEAAVRIEVIPEALGNEELLSLFAAARLPPRVCLPYVLRSVAA